jgi:3-oxoacyl-(acyl-carrier-protein) synthase/NAD(P)H-dependent flavin oxidoreductase YrpB (nitropropane dioxygenase family)
MVGSTVICSPEHLCDPALAIAAVRAGEIGLLDLGYEVEGAVRREALGRLASLAGDSTAWGVRWQTWARAARMPEVLAGLWEEPVPKLLIAGLDPETPATLRKALAQGRKIAREIWIEAYSVEQAEGAAGAGFDGVVLKGNESGGRVAADSAFLLLQAVRGRIECPCWVQGAWGPDTAAAAHLAGAAGIVLGEELWLARESPLAADGRRFESLDGSETVCLGEGRHPVRLFRQVDRETLQTFENGGDSSELWPEVLLERWRELAPHEGGPLPLGQGIAFARGLAERFLTVGGILQAYRDTIEHHLSAAPRLRALAPDGPMARVHGTLHPIVQGPMTRVSDTAPFARAVAENGGLPFLALALMRGPEVRELLRAVQQELGDLPWGVGVLGFVPPELRQEQLEVIREIRPRFGIIAGGRPGQAAEMEAEGIATYLHVPSPGLLETFLEQGARKFIFEGRECGGHVGPRSSLTLWQSAIDILCDAGLTHPEEIQVLFAGGVHDALSAAMVQTLAVPLTERGMKIGALMGTAYLFTPEAVATGAISEVFQEQAIACKRTALLESGVGHASRCAESPFAEEFREQRRALQKKGQPAEEVRFELEMLNVGRLRLASKGLVRRATDAEADASQSPLARGARMLEGELVEVDEKAQRSGGMFMMGQLAALREERQTMAELHEEVSRGSTDLLSEFARERVPAEAAAPVRGEPIAVVGMAGIFPDAPDLRAFWRNVVEGRDSVREVSESRWNQEQFFDPDRTARDRLYAVRGAFLQPLRLDPVRFRIPPATVGSVEPIQLLALEAARRALQDAGLDRRPFPRERAAVIFGSSGIHDVGIAYAFRTLIGHYLSRSGAVDEAECERIVEKVRDILPGWSEDSFPGILPNVISGRITNRLDLRGANYTIDAACSSALAAVHAAVEQLRAHTCDIALTGGVDSSNNAFTFMCFAKTHALTPGDKPRPFDANADGIVLGEGVGAVVLKRLKDAERDGDDIYAVIRGLGCSSDGRNRSLTAPHPDGQVLALRRAYEDAGVDPSSVALVEAHATGTTVGDAAEIEGLRQVFGQGGKGDCAIGSVKSQIGHAKSSAGIAGLIKAALAVRHGILPPTINVETPNPRVQEEDCPFYINTRCRPWIRKRESLPRRAGVSAFGFGGTNFHVVLESYESAFCDASKMDLTPRPAELFVWQRASRKEMTETVRNFQRSLEGLQGVRIDELAACLHGEERTRDASAVRLAIMAKSTDDLVAKCEKALEALRKDGPTVDPLSVPLPRTRGAARRYARRPGPVRVVRE